MIILDGGINNGAFDAALSLTSIDGREFVAPRKI